MPRNLSNSTLMKPFVVLALPGMYLFYKYNQYKRQQQEQNRRKVTERELAHLNHKIDKLLSKLDENEPDLATTPEDECVICVNAKATMQTYPCGHRVVCRKCFVKTIQMAVSQRLLPLRCVICRAKVLRLKQTTTGGTPIPSSVSQYSVGSRWSVPQSSSLYSMGSGSSNISGVSTLSSVSSASGSSAGSYRVGRTGKTSRPHSVPPRKTTGSKSVRFSSSGHSVAKHPASVCSAPVRAGSEPRSSAVHYRPLSPIQEFRLSKESLKSCKEKSSSTRIRCAQKIVTQLEKPSLPRSSNPYRSRSPLKPKKKEDKTERRKDAKQEKKKNDEKEKDTKHEKKKEDKKGNPSSAKGR